MSNDLLHDENNCINEEDIKLEFFTEEDIKLELQIKEEILDENYVDGYQQIQSVDNKLPDDIASMRKSVYIIEESIKQEHEIDSKLIIKDEILVENSSDDDQQAQIVRKQSTDGETFMKESVLGRSTNEYCKRARRKKNYSENKCGVCGMIFKLKSDLVEHRRIHTGKKPYSCDVCNQTFTYKFELIRHQEIIHGTRYSCDLCDKSFSRKQNLTNHKRTHGEKTFSCDKCDKRFIFKWKFDLNEIIHMDEKHHFTCDVCDKSFSSSRNFYLHKREHLMHKLHACEICNKKFTQKCELDKHKKSHLGKICDVCGIVFKLVSDLNDHKRIHIGEKSYSCGICYKSFILKCDMITHQQIHTVDKKLVL